MVELIQAVVALILIGAGLWTVRTAGPRWSGETAKGIASMGPARRNVARAQERWRRLLHDGEMEELVRLLRKLNDPAE